MHVYVGLSLSCLSSRLYWTFLFSQTSVDYATTVEDYLAQLVEILGWICRRGCCWRAAPPPQPAAPWYHHLLLLDGRGGDAGSLVGMLVPRQAPAHVGHAVAGYVQCVCVCVCTCVHARVYTAGCGHWQYTQIWATYTFRPPRGVAWDLQYVSTDANRKVFAVFPTLRESGYLSLIHWISPGTAPMAGKPFPV